MCCVKGQWKEGSYSRKEEARQQARYVRHVSKWEKAAGSNLEDTKPPSLAGGGQKG